MNRFRGRNFLSMSVDMFEVFSRGGFGAGSAIVSFNDTGEETSWTTASAGKGTDGEREIDSDTVIEPCGEK